MNQHPEAATPFRGFFIAAPILCLCFSQQRAPQAWLWNMSHGVRVTTVDAALKQAICLSSSDGASLQATGSKLHKCSCYAPEHTQLLDEAGHKAQAVV